MADSGKRDRPTDSARAYVRVRGLPYSATQEQVREFFAQSIALELADVALRYNACGEAFVRVHAEQLAEALALNKHVMGKRYLEIFETDQAEFERCESSAGATDGSKALVRMRGLPWGTTTEDIGAFFSGHEVVAMRINTRPDGRQTGEAYVEFDSEEAAAAALAFHRKEMRGRYIEIFAATKGEMLAVAASHGTAAPPEDERRVVRVRGFPWASTAVDVAAFFSGIPIEGGAGDGGGVLMVSQPDGRSAGEAFVLFASADGAAAALKRDKNQMGNRWVDVKQSTLAEMRGAAGAAGGAAGSLRAHAWMSADWAIAHPLELAPHLSTSLQPTSLACVRMKGLGADQTEESIGAFLRGAAPPIPPAAIRLVFRKELPSGEGRRADRWRASRAAPPLTRGFPPLPPVRFWCVRCPPSHPPCLCARRLRVRPLPL